MLSCEETSRLVSESMDRALPLNKRIAVRMHLLMCTSCARFRKQLLVMRLAARKIQDELGDTLTGPSLDPESRQRMKKTIRLSLEEGNQGLS